ncbi:MAG: RHS repeat protein, partial [Clostridia bacterium]|nr:RHS repeat protein [Clostridia bacterium]
MKQENEKLISGEETQPEESMTPGGNSRVIEDPFIDTFASGTTETVTNQDFVKHGVDIQESFGSNSAYEVNLRKGKLFFTQHLFTAEGLHLPASFAVSYNQRFASSNYTTDGKPLLFKGWKLNYQQFIRFVDDKCVYVDGAFKEHVFKRSTNNTSVYLDVSIQSGTILRPATDEETFADYVIADGANTDLFFKDNRLVKIRQTRGSTPVETTITYDALNRVTQVTDGLGNNYAVHYLTNAVTITDANGTVLATLTADSNNCLESVDYYEDTDSGKVCQFTYYPSTCLLSNVRDQFAQEKAIFAYHENGKLGAIGKYVIKGDTSAEVQSKTITYYSDHTIVSQSNGSIYEEAQIRHKYTFNTNGSLANVCEIDTTGNAIGEQTFVTHENGVERHVSYKAAETISLWDEDWPAGIGPGVLIQGPIEVGNKTISIPNPNNNTMDVTFSWHMEYEDLFLPYP